MAQITKRHDNLVNCFPNVILHVQSIDDLMEANGMHPVARSPDGIYRERALWDTELIQTYLSCKN